MGRQVISSHLHEQPENRLTRLCSAMADALEAHPENGPDVRVIISLISQGTGEAGEAGVVGVGYEGGDDMVADLLLQLQAMLHTQGKSLMIVDVGRG